jgi:hypothetical protein
MLDRWPLRVQNNVTHRMCTHRLHDLNMAVDAARHPHPIRSRHPPYPRGTGDQSGRGCGAVRAASDVLQRHRARDSERVTGEHREGCERAEDEPVEAV